MVARAGGYACADPSRSDFLLVRVIFFPPGVPLLLLFPVRLVRSTSDDFNRLEYNLLPQLGALSASVSNWALSRPLSRTGGSLSASVYNLLPQLQALSRPLSRTFPRLRSVTTDKH